jgi:hypothetical protein
MLIQSVGSLFATLTLKVISRVLYKPVMVPYRHALPATRARFFFCSLLLAKMPGIINLINEWGSPNVLRQAGNRSRVAAELVSD